MHAAHRKKLSTKKTVKHTPGSRHEVSTMFCFQSVPCEGLGLGLGLGLGEGEDVLLPVGALADKGRREKGLHAGREARGVGCSAP